MKFTVTCFVNIVAKLNLCFAPIIKLISCTCTTHKMSWHTVGLWVQLPHRNCQNVLAKSTGYRVHLTKIYKISANLKKRS